MLKSMGIKVMRFLLLLMAVTAIAFIFVSFSPMDPIVQYTTRHGMSLSDEQKALLMEQWDMQKPLLTRYFSWLSHVFQGDLGYSYMYSRPVISIIIESVGASLLLMSISWVLQGILGFFLGILAGIHHDRLLDNIIKTFAIITTATPTYWMAILCILIFSVKLQWFPIGFGTPIGMEGTQVTFWDRLYHSILPALTLAIIGTGRIILHTREKVIETMNEDFVLYQRSRGYEGWSLIWKAALRNVMLPAVTLQFMNFSELFSGTILAEQAFNYPGLGKYTVNAGVQGDLPLLLGITIFCAMFVYVGNQCADGVAKYVDYRTKRRYEA